MNSIKSITDTVSNFLSAKGNVTSLPSHHITVIYPMTGQKHKSVDFGPLNYMEMKGQFHAAALLRSVSITLGP
jgi:hypothetical protein